MKFTGINETIRRALTAAGLMKSPQTQPADERREHPVGEGRFLARSFTNAAGSRDYKLYVPACYSPDTTQPLPLVVMLHGCTQSPDDFAAGTRMNALAEEHRFLVVFPAQSANANGSRCWNWFRPQDQRRDQGEPSIIAGITREVLSTYRVDPRRVFVAGMSAGAAMALILGETYPELYAAVGAHSGPPFSGAHDVPSAFAAMQGRAARSQASSAVPTIVFHGDADHTVDASNADANVERVMGAAGSKPALERETTESAPGGRRYRRTDYMDAANHCVIEKWIVHGAGHAWSGGSPSGSFTDPAGPDASAEMVRFFLSQLRAGTS